METLSFRDMDTQISPWGLRFRDPDLQSSYRARATLFCLTPAKMYAAFHIFFACYSLASYWGSELTVAFFLYFVPLVVGLSLYICCKMPVTKRHIELLLLIAVVLLDLWTNWMCHLQAGEWFDWYAANRFTSDGYEPNQLEEIHNTLQDLLSRNSINIHLIFSVPQLLVILFLTADYLLLLWCTVCFSLFVLLSPNITMGAAIFAVITRCVISILFSIFALFVKFIIMQQHKSEIDFKGHTEASLQADSILNHSLKNRMADAAGEVEIFLSKYRGPGEQTASLWQCVRSLRRGMEMCQHRHALLKLAAGKYTPRFTAVDVHEVGNALALGRDLLNKNFVRMWAQFDVVVCGMILENALSNAFKHGCPRNPDVSFTIAVRGESLDPDRVPLEFSVTNRAHPDRPKITDEFIDKLIQGAPDADRHLPLLSDRIGLSHCFMVAKSCGFSLSLKQDDDVVAFKLSLIAETMTSAPRAERRRWHVPPGLHYHVLDDSAVARRVVTHHLMKHASPGSVQAFGETADDFHNFVQASMADPVDVVIIDQNLEYNTGTYLGTDLLEQFVAERFQGLLCMRSANSSEADVELYIRKGAHCILEKDMLGSEMVEAIARAYIFKCDQQAHSETATVTQLQSPSSRVTTPWALDEPFLGIS